MKPIVKILGLAGILALVLGRKKILATAQAAGSAALNFALSEEQQTFIDQLNPIAVPVFSSFIKDIEDSGWNVIITSTSRDFSTTPYQFGDYHMYGLAMDMNATKGATWLKMASPKQDWINSGIPAIAVAHNLRWGGNFTPTATYPEGDKVHFDMGNSWTTANLYALSQQQGVDPAQINLS